jgi:hypothetical protein
VADEHRHRLDGDAARVARWLAEHAAEFEGEGVSEDSLAASVGLKAEAVTRAVDHLENREAVARLPHGHAGHASFLLQPARGWADIREEVLGGQGSGA